MLFLESPISGFAKVRGIPELNGKNQTSAIPFAEYQRRQFEPLSASIHSHSNVLNSTDFRRADVDHDA